MDRLISEQKAIEAINDYWGEMEKPTIDGYINAIKTVPSAEPQIGYWVEEIINIGSRKVFCSECGCSAPFEYVSNGDVYSASGYGVINKTKFCPNCGAKMQE